MDSKKPLFIQIRDMYEHLIDIGALNPGDELPSVRAVGLEYNANPNTVQRAFSLMVEDGYLESIPKKGFYVKEARNADYKKQYLQDTLKDLLDKGYSKDEIIKELGGVDNDSDKKLG